MDTKLEAKYKDAKLEFNNVYQRVIYLIIELAKNDERIFTQPLFFGKFNNFTLLEVSIKDPSYLRWMLNKIDDLNEDIKYSVLKIIDVLENNDVPFKELPSSLYQALLSKEDIKFFKEINKMVAKEVSRPSVLGVFVGWVADKWHKTYNHVMSVKFLTIFSMFMLAISAIYFDIDGWKETYHRFDGNQIVFIIGTLYLAKIAIIKILSLKNKITEDDAATFFGRFKFYANHYLLRTVLSMSLISMVFVSTVGIYSSLAVNTVGDINVVNQEDEEIKLIESEISLLDEKIKISETKISNMEKSIKEMPENYKSAKRLKLSAINKENTVISDYMTEKTQLIKKKNQAYKNLTSTLSEKSNKSLNFTAQLLGMELGELLKYINLLMTFVLEVTYLSLTWFVVRLHSKENDSESAPQSPAKSTD